MRESMLDPSGEGWEAAGHADPTAWLAIAGRLGAALLLAIFLFLLVRGLLRHRRYRAADALEPSDMAAIRSALADAERRTVGEILPVVVERSDRHPGAAWLSSLVVVLLGSAVLAPWLPWDRPVVLLAAQAILGAAGYGLAVLLPGYRRAFVSEARATEMAEEQAFQEFYRYGLHRTEGRTGVLLFVSLFEHRTVVVADEGIDACVEPDRWSGTVRAVLDGIAAGSLRSGLLAGVASAAEVLAAHFPWSEGDRNEIPERVIVREE
ncbi:MAG: hypothetical protein AB1726_17225 [Planctomycetota bacterium]